MNLLVSHCCRNRMDMMNMINTIELGRKLIVFIIINPYDYDNNETQLNFFWGGKLTTKGYAW